MIKSCRKSSPLFSLLPKLLKERLNGPRFLSDPSVSSDSTITESERHAAFGPGWRALWLTIVAGALYFCVFPTVVAAATIYVDNPVDYIVTTDAGAAGLSCGDTVTWNPGADTQHGGAVAGLVYCTNAFEAIQAAVNAASAGDTIRVGPGTFSELVTVNKQLSMLGNQVGLDARSRTGVPETVVNGGDLGGGVHSTSFNITASDVALDGFTTQDTTSGNQFGFGILLSPGTAGSEVRNNIIQNNIAGLGLANNSAANQTIIERNLFRNNNQPGPGSGFGIYTDQFNAGGTLTNVLIDNNSFVGHSGQGIGFSSTSPAQPATGITISNNLFSGNGRALLAFNLTSSSITSNTIQNSTDSATADLRLFEGVNGLTITNNVLQNGAGRALRISNIGTGAPNTTNVSFTFNSIAGYTGPAGTFQLDSGMYTGTLNATQNWWNDITGPTTTANPGGTGETLSDPDGVVDFQPWLVYAPDATSGTAGVQFVTGFTITAQTTILTATNNNYRRLVNVVESLRSGQTVNLVGTFDWTEANAAASWALGNDGVSSADDFSLVIPVNLNNVTITAASLGAARIHGPGDLAASNLEGVFVFDGGDNQNWTISNLEIFDFDLAIGMFTGAGGTDAFNNTHITNNYIRVARDLNPTVAPADVNQNIGIHFSFGTNQVISGNTIEIQGDGVSNSAGGNFASDVGMQSNVSGGNVYDGLLITNNIIRVLSAQSADPENILGIWENGHAHTSDITVSGNQFLNPAAGNNPATNLQRGFRVTSHSSATTTVTYQNNTVTGANIGFQWLAGQNFAGNQPVKLTSNTITNNATGVLVQSQGLADLSFNRIVGNSVVGTSNLDGTLTAENNWWGCNAGPGNNGCNGVTGTVDFNPWLVLGISAAPGIVITGGTSTATADMTHNSDNAVPSAAIFLPSTAVTFGATLGTMAPPTVTLSSGQATSIFTSTSAGNGSASATVDNETVSISIPITVISPANVTGTKTVSGTFAPGGVITYAVVLSNSGPAAQLDNPGNEFTDVLPLGVTLVSASATSGTAVATIGTGTVTWNGSIPAGSSVIINITATINSNAGTTISNQGTISNDGDGNGTNESSRMTDDPSVGGASDPTSFSVSKGNQTITFGALANKTFGDPDFPVSATATSGLAVSFAASGQCTVSGNTVHITSAGSCTITASQAGNSNFNPAPDVAQSFTIANRALITLSQSNYNVNESTGFVTITVNRTGDLSIPVSVDYATDDTGSSDVCSTLNSGMSSARCDFGLTLGTLRFAATETQKTFVIPITQDSYTEGSELFTVNLSNLTGSDIAFATPSSATVTINDSAAPAPNANDDTDAFVRQQYRDFLNREADPAGLAFWTNEITSCGNDAACRNIKRVNVSAAFFLSIEFQTTGNLVRNFYVAALDRPLTNNMPAFVEFERDTQAMQSGVIVEQGNWQQTLNTNRDVFMREFATRAEFVGLYPTTDTPTQYVDKLYLHAGITPTSSERDNAIAEFGSATTAADAGARGRALLEVTQNTTFQQREMNRSFVQMQYFGYLRRNPNDAPDSNFAGYDFWLSKLNQFNGNFQDAEMVKAFISSSEYRRRFGP